MSVINQMHAMPKESGIYKIINIHSGKAYIGSSKNIRHRCRRHIQMLNCGRHKNDDLQMDWTASGSSGFSVVVLTLCSVDALEMIEQSFMDDCELKYNAMPLAYRGSGYVHTDKSVNKMTLNRRIRYDDPAFIEKQSKARKESWARGDYPKNSSTMARLNKDPVFCANRIASLRTPECREKHRKNAKDRFSDPDFINKIKSARGDPIRMFLSPSGEIVTTGDVASLCRKFGLRQSNMASVATGKKRSCQGWRKYEPIPVSTI